jgi:hypothetical protein
MATLFYRPTGPGRSKHDAAWKLKGDWGERMYPPSSKVALYDRLHAELIESGVLPKDSPRPSNHHHDHVTMAVMGSSYVGGRWVADR